jgi:hypothetical protein
MTDAKYVERRGAQALLATYLQLTRSAGLAQQLHQARKRATERRIDKTTDEFEQQRLRQRLDAQTTQGEAIDNALSRLQSRVTELSSFAEAGLTMEDFKELGLHGVVDEQTVNATVDAARGKRDEVSDVTGEDGESREVT